MKNKIKHYIKLYRELTKTYYVRILTCALTYELIMLLIPVLLIINTVAFYLGINSNTYPKSLGLSSGITTVIFLVNLFWTTSRLMLSFNQTSEMIYYGVARRSFIKSRIASFLAFLGVILLIISSLIIIFVLNYWIGIVNIQLFKYLLYICEYIVKFLSVLLITSFIYKKSIPVKISFSKTLITSLVITSCWYLLTIFCLPILKYLLAYSYVQIYSTLASIFIVIYYLYLIVKVFIIGMIYQYYLYQKSIE